MIPMLQNPYDDPYLFPLTALLGKVVSNIRNNPCKRTIVIAPDWPKMPWFWDLVEMSTEVPLCLPLYPDLLTQPFNQVPHNSLDNLNPHAWLLEPLMPENKAFLRQWRNGLRLLRDAQLEPSMKQSHT